MNLTMTSSNFCTKKKQYLLELFKVTVKPPISRLARLSKKRVSIILSRYSNTETFAKLKKSLDNFEIIIVVTLSKKIEIKVKYVLDSSLWEKFKSFFRFKIYLSFQKLLQFFYGFIGHLKALDYKNVVLSVHALLYNRISYHYYLANLHM